MRTPLEIATKRQADLNWTIDHFEKIDLTEVGKATLQTYREELVYWNELVLSLKLAEGKKSEIVDSI